MLTANAFEGSRFRSSLIYYYYSGNYILGRTPAAYRRSESQTNGRCRRCGLISRRRRRRQNKNSRRACARACARGDRRAAAKGVVGTKPSRHNPEQLEVSLRNSLLYSSDTVFPTSRRSRLLHFWYACLRSGGARLVNRTQSYKK